MSLVLAFTMAACSPTEPTDSPDDVSMPMEPTEPVGIEVPAAPMPDAPLAVEPMLEVTPAVPMEPVTPAEPVAPVDPAAAPAIDGAATNSAAVDTTGLVGPQWKYGEYLATFKDDGTMTISVGGSPVEGSYELKDGGAIDINALGQTISGTWDGTALTIDGTALEKVS